eukprot:TRINITY_DN18136_c0_g1_i1.p1 TRINITY_DN18136_c0_g1~~TRINITY_DN18136_c0_g1_i1.p1  ORF type:complete len:545 (+),score=79.97 TRINITY_DN18136_c0_g1_i1:66-1700(+)
MAEQRVAPAAGAALPPDLCDSDDLHGWGNQRQAAGRASGSHHTDPPLLVEGSAGGDPSARGSPVERTLDGVGAGGGSGGGLRIDTDLALGPAEDGPQSSADTHCPGPALRIDAALALDAFGSPSSRGGRSNHEAMPLPSAGLPSVSSGEVNCVVNGLLVVHVVPGGERFWPVTKKLRVNGDGNALYVHVAAACSRKVLAEEFGEHGAAKAMRVTATFASPRRADSEAAERTVIVGYISEATPYCAGSDFIPFCPSSVTFRTKFVQQPGNAEEERLCVGIRDILNNETINPYKGSLPSALTQNHAKVLPLYSSVVEEGYGGSWHQFLRAHPNEFTLFQMSEEQVRHHNLAPFVKPQEVRVAMVGVAATDRDAACAAANRAHEQRLIELLQEVLTGHEDGMDQRQVMEQLGTSAAFLHFARPSLCTLSRFLASHRDRFVWSNHPDLVSTAGLSRGDRVAYLHRPRAQGARVRQPQLATAAGSRRATPSESTGRVTSRTAFSATWTPRTPDTATPAAGGQRRGARRPPDGQRGRRGQPAHSPSAGLT